MTSRAHKIVRFIAGWSDYPDFGEICFDLRLPEDIDPAQALIEAEQAAAQQPPGPDPGQLQTNSIRIDRELTPSDRKDWFEG